MHIYKMRDGITLKWDPGESQTLFFYNQQKKTKLQIKSVSAEAENFQEFVEM